MAENVSKLMNSVDKNKQVFNINENSMVLVVSDIHLGALKAKHDQFKDFLNAIINKINTNNEFKKNFRALIILGDFFDLITDSYKDISENYKAIFDLLDKLQTKKIYVIITLGNHDICVIGNYDRKFNKRKRKLIKNFKKKNFKWAFLKDENFWQFIFLRKDKNEEWELALFDSINNAIEETTFKKKIKRKIPLNIKVPSSVDKDYNCLLTHGYQFDPNLTNFAPIWCFGIEYSSDLMKEIADGVWNGVVKPIIESGEKISSFDDIQIESKIKIEFQTQEQSYKVKYKKELKERQKKEIKILMEYIKNSEIKRDRIKENDNYNKEIIDTFLPKLEEEGYSSKITHIIYGHTHQYQEETKIDNKILIVNTGAWQHVDKPSFVEIYLDGTSMVK